MTDTSLREEIRQRWNAGEFISHTDITPEATYPSLPWVPYEEYMRAKLVEVEPEQLGRLIIEFPPEASEDNDLHIHPASDRKITVISGGGEFVAKRHGTIQRFPLVAGEVVWMPRSVLHTFLSGPEGLLVESLHNPWIPFEDERCLVYPKRMKENWQ